MELQNGTGMLRVVGVHAAQEAEMLGHGCGIKSEIIMPLCPRGTHRSHRLEREELLGAHLRDFLAQGRVILPCLRSMKGFGLREIHLRTTVD